MYQVKEARLPDRKGVAESLQMIVPGFFDFDIHLFLTGNDVHDGFIQRLIDNGKSVVKIITDQVDDFMKFDFAVAEFDIFTGFLSGKLVDA